jgi:Lon-like ATP-dependent protease
MYHIGTKLRYRNHKNIIKKTINRKYNYADWYNPNDISMLSKGKKIPQSVPILLMETSHPLAPFPNFPTLFNYRSSSLPFNVHLQSIADSESPYVGLYPKISNNVNPNNIGVIAEVKVRDFKVEVLPFSRIIANQTVPQYQNNEDNGSDINSELISIKEFETTELNSPHLVPLMNAVQHAIQDLELFHGANASESYLRYNFSEHTKKVKEEYLPYIYYAAAIKLIKPWKIENFAGIQNLIQMPSFENQLKYCLSFIEKCITECRYRYNINAQINAETQKSNREYEDLMKRKILGKRLGINENRNNNDKFLKTIEKNLENKDIPTNVRELIKDNIEQFKNASRSGETKHSLQNFLEWISCLPWGVNDPETIDIKKVAATLEEDHFGIEDAKKRIVEIVATGAMRGSMKGKILCLYGPPGTGKTSIGKSIAKSLGRQFYRFSVGGLHDVHEIKGHRKTYIASMPGKIIQALKTVQTSNPVILIDEIDKLDNSRFNPSATFLELFDPELNGEFLDHYLDVPFDCSKILFICTANDLSKIPPPLLDRMEIINLSGYVYEEKQEILRKHLVPDLLKKFNIPKEKFHLSDNAEYKLIHQYCREPGVRSLEKSIEKVLSKTAYNIVENPSSSVEITLSNLEDFVGPPPFRKEKYYISPTIGVVMGLAYNEVGGSVLYVESTTEKFKTPGITMTGRLGVVLKESVQIALSYAKMLLREIDPYNKFFEENHIRVHLPEGSTRKEGPSAGCTLVTSLLSLALKHPVPDDIGMTGEITLNGKVLPIGGVKEKIIAAKRVGIRKVIIPEKNKMDVTGLKDYIYDGMTIYYASNYRDVYNVVFSEPKSNYKVKSNSISTGAM